MRKVIYLTVLLSGTAFAGAIVGGGTATPEPGTIFLVAGAGVAAFLLRKRLGNRKR
jgi:hypothetical protein